MFITCFGPGNHTLDPMLTSVLLRAPRRFVHPNWVPRQNMTRDMDLALHAFNDPSHSNDNHQTSASKSKSKIKTECIRVRCHASNTDQRSKETLESADSADNVSTAQDEDDELIWWAWDGKIEGFSEW